MARERRASLRKHVVIGSCERKMHSVQYQGIYWISIERSGDLPILSGDGSAGLKRIALRAQTGPASKFRIGFEPTSLMERAALAYIRAGVAKGENVKAT